MYKNIHISKNVETFFLSEKQNIRGRVVVELDGIEPTTSCLQSRRSPS